MHPLRSGVLAVLTVGTLAGSLTYGGVVVGAAPDATPLSGAAQTPSSARPQSPGPYAPPVSDGVVVRGFEAPPERWAAGHRGIDLAAQTGQEVLAPADGVVTFAGPVVDRDVLTILHPDGRRSSLEPVTSTLSPGDTVAQGQVVGHLQGTVHHCVRASCVHWGVREGDVYVDPSGLLPGAAPVVLLPERARVRTGRSP
ncbi:M23 family metallopeptidase [Cellulomonas sp. P22]|uniref:M23 family metallopeptidase n=1 Tax=Cellulomonas sp. P22 TaxID=3373189 RepID=UPI0037B4B2F8